MLAILPQVLDQGRSPKGGLVVKQATGNAAKVRSRGLFVVN